MPCTKLAAMDASTAQFDPALEAALLRELHATWHQINSSHFAAKLSPPTLELVDTRATLGRWQPTSRTIEISRPLILTERWGAVVEVLKHEMAHQFVHEVLAECETAHGPAFRDVCKRLGIDARAAGLPRPSSADAADPDEKIRLRVVRLLALAQSPNRHEAEAAMATAQRLMLRHNLDAAHAATPRDYSFLQLGKPTGRVAEHERLVAMILGRHFFVETIWIPVFRALEGKRGSVLEICGTWGNLSIAEYVHGFLHETAERLWRAHQSAARIASNRERRTYLAGVMTGFADKLARQNVKHRGEGLVWIQDGNLVSYFRKRHPLVRHVRHAGQRRSDAWLHGREAGRAIVLHRPLETPVESRGRMLGFKR
ncbi:MAG: DUF2786 domain-containing protein [Myxococcota bacterium]|nr:DUF2786 domain-containing protein [Myxococcota bacterium]